LFPKHDVVGVRLKDSGERSEGGWVVSLPSNG
jgi:hypothetical protein